MKAFALVFFISIIFAVCACNNSNRDSVQTIPNKPDSKQTSEETVPEKETVNEKIKSYAVKGNPLSLIKNTVANPKSFLNVDNISKIDGYRVNITLYPQHEIPPSDLKKPEGTPDYDYQKNGMPKFHLEKFSKKVSGLYEYKGDDGLIFSISPSKDGSTLEFTKARTGNDESNIKILHYSKKEDFSAFSILFVTREYGSDMLVEAVFKKDDLDSPKITNEALKYRYMSGSGAKIGFHSKEPLVISLCGDFSKKFASSFETAIGEWKKTLANRLNIYVQYVDNCPPFSDLNFHGIYFVEDYLYHLDIEKTRLGMAQVIPNYSSSTIVDSDIFILGKEYEKIFQLGQFSGWDDPIFSNSDTLKFAILHEFGHLLGLGHTIGNIQSVMAVPSNIREIAEYDREAISVLYPDLKKNKKGFWPAWLFN